MASTTATTPSASTNSILLGAIAVVNSEHQPGWKKDEFTFLLAQLAHCPVAPAPSASTTSSSRDRSGSTVTLISAPAATPVPAPVQAANVNSNVRGGVQKCQGGHGYEQQQQQQQLQQAGRAHLLASLLPPTPPLSPTDPSLESSASPESMTTRTQQPQRPPPLPLATCLSANRSHSISAPGLEIATSLAERYQVPRESILLIGAAQVLRSYYEGQMRRDARGLAKEWHVVGRMEGCKFSGCGCLDYDLAIGLDGTEEQGGERCSCGHGYGMHEAWRWDPPAPVRVPEGALSSAGQEEEEARKSSRGRGQKGKETEADKDVEDASFAQTADDSFLFETDDESEAASRASSRSSSPASSSHFHSPSLFPTIPPQTPALSSSFPTLPLPLQSLPSQPSPGLAQLVKRFAYWTLWSYASLYHPSSTGRLKTNPGEVRECGEKGCNCADFYLDATWLRRRHSRRLSRESLRGWSRRQSLSLGLGMTPAGGWGEGGADGAVGGSGGCGGAAAAGTAGTVYGPGHSRRGSKDDGSGRSSMIPRPPAAHHDSTVVAHPANSRSATPRPSELSTTAATGPGQTIAQPRPTSRLSVSFPDYQPQPHASSSFSAAHAIERPSSRASFRSTYPDRPSSRASFRDGGSSYAGSAYGGSSYGGGGSRRNTAGEEQPHARCACGHVSSSHRSVAGRQSDLSWILVEWAYVALARLGGAAGAGGGGSAGTGVGATEGAKTGDGSGDESGNVVRERLTWPLSEDAGKEEALWRRGRDVRN